MNQTDRDLTLAEVLSRSLPPETDVIVVYCEKGARRANLITSVDVARTIAILLETVSTLADGEISDVAYHTVAEPH